MTFVEFFGDSYFLSWCALWLVWPVLSYTFLIINRVLRTIKVALRGWPPAHVDADGDWKPQKESE